MSKADKRSRGEFIGFDVDAETKRKLKIRAAMEDYPSLSAYMRDLVDGEVAEMDVDLK